MWALFFRFVKFDSVFLGFLRENFRVLELYFLLVMIDFYMLVFKFGCIFFFVIKLFWFLYVCCFNIFLVKVE